MEVNRIEDFVFMSPVTANLVDDALNVAKYDCNVIIQGETGVSKERVLDIIHQNSERKGKPCIKINCATIQENLAESEFFGYEKGSFTGASTNGKEGYFEMANNGTLFLDEIGSLPLAMQSKLSLYLGISYAILFRDMYCKYTKCFQYGCVATTFFVICCNNLYSKDLKWHSRLRK
jgi:transcriptional regulator with PAS, ATPase and Fis domain